MTAKERLRGLETRLEPTRDNLFWLMERLARDKKAESQRTEEKNGFSVWILKDKRTASVTVSILQPLPIEGFSALSRFIFGRDGKSISQDSILAEVSLWNDFEKRKIGHESSGSFAKAGGEKSFGYKHETNGGAYETNDFPLGKFCIEEQNAESVLKRAFVSACLLLQNLPLPKGLENTLFDAFRLAPA